MKNFYHLTQESAIKIKEIAMPGAISHLFDWRTEFDPSRHGEKHFVDQDGYLITNTITEVVRNNELDFNYRINSNGFRSQHFKDLKTEDINILYGGCSWTFGEGLPEEYTWTQLLTQKLENHFSDKNVESFNTSYPGASIHLIIRNIFAFIEKHGNPNYIFMCLPDVARGILYSAKLNEFMKMYPANQFFDQRIPKEHLEYSKNYVAENNWILAIDLIRSLELYCKTNGISLVWNTWWAPDVNFIQELDFKNYNHLNIIENQFWQRLEEQETNPFKFDNIDNLPYWKIARDGSHPGTCWTTTQSEHMFARVVSNG
jgi:hypothetical protein